MREVVCVCLGVVALQPTRANHSIRTEYELERTSVNKKYEFLRQGNRLPTYCLGVLERERAGDEGRQWRGEGGETREAMIGDTRIGNQ